MEFFNFTIYNQFHDEEMREVLLRRLVYKQNTVKDSKKERLGCKNEKVEKQTQTFDHLVTIDTCKRGFT